MASFTWEKNRPGHGVVAAVLFLACYAVYGTQPKVGATTIAVMSAFLSRRSSSPARATRRDRSRAPDRWSRAEAEGGQPQSPVLVFG